MSGTGSEAGPDERVASRQSDFMAFYLLTVEARGIERNDLTMQRELSELMEPLEDGESPEAWSRALRRMSDYIQANVSDPDEAPAPPRVSGAGPVNGVRCFGCGRFIPPAEVTIPVTSCNVCGKRIRVGKSDTNFG